MTARSSRIALLARARRFATTCLSQRRLRYPVKLVNGRWTRISWETRD